MLKREKEEDKEFYKMVVLQEKRRLAKNPHLVTGTFGPGTGIKSLYQKIQDLLKDYYYPENEFNRLKLDVILAEKQLEEAQEELQKAETVIAGMKEKENQAITITNELARQVALLEKEILDSQMPEYEKLYVSGEDYRRVSCELQEAKEELQKAEKEIAALRKEKDEITVQMNEINDEAERARKAYQEATMLEHENVYVSGEDYKKLSCEKWLLQEELQEVKDKMEQMETELETIEDREEELENQLIEKENEQQNLEKRALEDDLKEAKEKISLMENELKNLKQDGKENTNIFGEILGEVLKDFSEKNPCAAWMESDKTRESWSIYIEPNEATDARFRSLKELFTEHCKKFCFVKNGKTNNISGEIQLKKALNFDELRDLLGPNIYLNGGPKEEATEKWSMAAKFNEKDYFSIFFTDEAQKNVKFRNRTADV
ncbi:tropomyosin-like [Magallana gigas]|uniref:tropomyosin-like n=1 Tax=Magallana gigas TaxID=29159 RepID=UPI00333FDA9D